MKPQRHSRRRHQRRHVRFLARLRTRQREYARRLAAGVTLDALLREIGFFTERESNVHCNAPVSDLAADAAAQ